MPELESEVSYLMIHDNGKCYHYVLNEGMNLPILKPNATYDDTLEYIKETSKAYSGQNWDSFVTNIIKLVSSTTVIDLCIMYCYYIRHLDPLMELTMISKYLMSIYNNTNFIYNQALTLKQSPLVLYLEEIAIVLIRIVENIICKSDDPTLLDYKSKIAMKRAILFRESPLYEELVSVQYSNLTRMRENGIF